ncbi:MAG: sigma-54 interaction domain-containing protein [Acidobacteriota bacterium]
MAFDGRTEHPRYWAQSPEACALWRGESSKAVHLRDWLCRIAGSSCNVLITGETGTGKEVAAGFIHEASKRRSCPIVAINCAALPETLLESELFGFEKGAFTGAAAKHEGRIWEANGGTLFLVEIVEMSLTAQAKILRVIETRELHRLGGRGSLPVNVRIVAATNQDLNNLVLQGKFRIDLLYRLKVAQVILPPLRERREDIAVLARYFLSKLGAEMDRPPLHFSAEALAAMEAYDFPGNARELRNAVETSLLSEPYPSIEIEHLPEQIAGSCGHRQIDDRSKIIEVLQVTNWNKSEAAKQLHWSRMTLYRKMALYCISDREQKAGRSRQAG